MQWTTIEGESPGIGQSIVSLSVRWNMCNSTLNSVIPLTKPKYSR